MMYIPGLDNILLRKFFRAGCEGVAGLLKRLVLYNMAFHSNVMWHHQHLWRGERSTLMGEGTS